MERDQLTDQPAHHGEIFRALFNDLTSNGAQWEPAPDKWCAMEVQCYPHHVRQLPDLRNAYLAENSNVSLDYAGTW